MSVYDYYICEAKEASDKLSCGSCTDVSGAIDAVLTLCGLVGSLAAALEKVESRLANLERRLNERYTYGAQVPERPMLKMVEAPSDTPAARCELVGRTPRDDAPSMEGKEEDADVPFF